LLRPILSGSSGIVFVGTLFPFKSVLSFLEKQEVLMKRLLIAALVLALTVFAGVGFTQPKQSGKAHHPSSAKAEKAPMMGPGMMQEMQQMMGQMQEMLKKEQLSKEDREKMRHMMSQMQGRMDQMHEMMSKCPMMQMMQEQQLEIEKLKKRLEELEKAKEKKS
jgi:uncharacterized membrane protein